MRVVVSLRQLGYLEPLEPAEADKHIIFNRAFVGVADLCIVKTEKVRSIIEFVYNVSSKSPTTVKDIIQPRWA